MDEDIRQDLRDIRQDIKDIATKIDDVKTEIGEHQLATERRFSSVELSLAAAAKKNGNGSAPVATVPVESPWWNDIKKVILVILTLTGGGGGVATLSGAFSSKEPTPQITEEKIIEIMKKMRDDDRREVWRVSRPDNRTPHQ